MTFSFEVLVSLKPGLADPQGRAVEASLPALGFAGVTGVRVGRHVRLDLEAASEGEAREQVRRIAEALLANPVIEDFRVLDTGSAEHPEPADGAAEPADGAAAGAPRS